MSGEETYMQSNPIVEARAEAVTRALAKIDPGIGATGGGSSWDDTVAEVRKILTSNETTELVDTSGMEPAAAILFILARTYDPDVYRPTPWAVAQVRAALR